MTIHESTVCILIYGCLFVYNERHDVQMSHAVSCSILLRLVVFCCMSWRKWDLASDGVIDLDSELIFSASFMVLVNGS